MQIIDAQAQSTHFDLAIVVSRYHEEITSKLLEGAMMRLDELGYDSERVTIIWVPGAVEIPITAQRLAQSDEYDGIICLGAVIYGETRHFDYVCQQVSHGCQQVALTQNIPVIFGVLTTNTLEQAHERAGGNKGNMGRHSVDAAVELISVLEQI